MLNFEVILIDEGMIHQWRDKPPAEEDGPLFEGLIHDLLIKGWSMINAWSNNEEVVNC
jgi:hypothetical protein